MLNYKATMCGQNALSAVLLFFRLNFVASNKVSKL